MAKPADLVARQPSSGLCPQTAHAHDQLQVLVISTYALGRQPFGIVHDRAAEESRVDTFALAGA